MADTQPPPDDDAQPERTAWHPLLVVMLQHLLPREQWTVTSELPLSREPRRIDVVIVRRTAAETDEPAYLASVLGGLRAHNLVHFKGATDALERDDAMQVTSYALQYMIHEGLRDPSAVALRIVAPTLTPRFAAQLRALGGALSPTSKRGVHEGLVGPFALRVVETSIAWNHEREHLLYTVSPGYISDASVLGTFDDRERALCYVLAQFVRQLSSDPKWRAMMKDAAIFELSADQALRELLATLPVEMRLQGLRPDERLADLSPADAVLALPDEVLRGLSESYVATLPEPVQNVVRARRTR